MTEIKKRFTCEHGSWKSSCDICQLVQEIEEQKAENTSLITTIESQKEEIEKLHEELNESLKVSEGRYMVAQKAIQDGVKVQQDNGALLNDIRNLFQRFLDCGDYRASDALDNLLIRYNTVQPTVQEGEK